MVRGLFFAAEAGRGRRLYSREHKSQKIKKFGTLYIYKVKIAILNAAMEAKYPRTCPEGMFIVRVERTLHHDTPLNFARTDIFLYLYAQNLKR